MSAPLIVTYYPVENAMKVCPFYSKVHWPFSILKIQVTKLYLSLPGSMYLVLLQKMAMKRACFLLPVTSEEKVRLLLLWWSSSHKNEILSSAKESPRRMKSCFACFSSFASFFLKPLNPYAGPFSADFYATQMGLLKHSEMLLMWCFGPLDFPDYCTFSWNQNAFPLLQVKAEKAVFTIFPIFFPKPWFFCWLQSLRFILFAAFVVVVWNVVCKKKYCWEVPFLKRVASSKVSHWKNISL